MIVASIAFSVIITDCTASSLLPSYHPKAFEFSDTAGESRKAGRVRGALLPAEYELERLISNIVNPLPSWNASVPAHQWEGVDCSDEGNILVFVSEETNLRGTLLWDALPRSLHRFSVFTNQLTGGIDLVNLPPHLSGFDVSYNQFTGRVDLSHLPSTLSSLILSMNKLSGQLTIANLPSGLLSLSLRHNAELVGTISAQLLPESLTYKAFQGTKLQIQN